MLETFIIKALIVGSILGIAAGFIGNFLVASRQSMMSDMIAHTSLFGVGLGIFLGISPITVGMLVGVISAILLAFLSFKKKSPADAVAVMILTTGLALAILLSHISTSNSFNFENYLFGSILTISDFESVLITAASLIISILIWFIRGNLFKTIVDRNFAISQNINVKLYEFLFIISIGILVASSLKVIGGLLISALLVIPVLISNKISTHFNQGLIFSATLNVLAIIIGLSSSYFFDIPTSSSIVLTLSGFYLLTLFLEKFYKKFNLKN